MKATNTLAIAFSRRRFLQLGTAAVALAATGGCARLLPRRRVPLPVNNPPPLFVAEWLPSGLQILREKLPAAPEPWQCFRLETLESPEEPRTSVLLFTNEGGLWFAVDGRDRELSRPMYPDRYGSRRILRDAWGELRFDLVSGEALGRGSLPGLREWIVQERGDLLIVEKP